MDITSPTRPQVSLEHVHNLQDMAEPTWGERSKDVRSSSHVGQHLPVNEVYHVLTVEVCLFWDEKTLLLLLEMTCSVEEADVFWLTLRVQ